jgi:hypothetical protein
MLRLVAVLVMIVASTVHAADPAPKDYWVKASVTEERDAPNGRVVNRIYIGQKVTIYRMEGDWALITEPRFQPAWVKTADLSPTPIASPPATVMDDPRIAKNAIPGVGADGHTAKDVEHLKRGAKWALDTGRCKRVEYGNKSVSKPGTYFVMCENRNVFFTERDLPR